MSDLFTLVEPGFDKAPNSTALISPQGQAVSYDRLRLNIEAFCTRAYQCGVRGGDHVCVEVNNPAIVITLALALSRLGAVLIGGRPHRHLQSEGLRVDCLIADTVRPGTEVKTIHFDPTWSAKSTQPVAVPVAGLEELDPTATILGSSGTTGQPKFMAFPLKLVQQRLNDNDLVHGTDYLRRLITFGILTPFGLEIVLRTLRSGGLVAWPVDNPNRTLDRINEFGLEEAFATPGVLAELAHSQKVNPRDLGTFRRIVSGGSLLSPELARLVKAQLASTLINLYGSSELGPTACIELRDNSFVPGIAGKPVDWIKVAIVEESGRPVPNGRDGIIRLEASEDRMLNGYLNPGGDGLSRFDGRRFIPGDTGYLDASGQLVITGRISDLINTGGNKVAPTIFEGIASKIRGVRACAAVAVPNADGFDDVGLVIVRKCGFDKNEVKQRLEARFGTTARLRFAYSETIPLNENGKPDRIALRGFFENA